MAVSQFSVCSRTDRSDKEHRPIVKEKQVLEDECRFVSAPKSLLGSNSAYKPVCNCNVVESL